MGYISSRMATEVTDEQTLMPFVPSTIVSLQIYVYRQKH